ncbi:ATP-binding cassette sub-family G member 2-like [Sinocyclocheilus grahami]|uniref:ATP-binding cassette sub-family G member 2-like n=1 Tax=Sinocyclocheilus grahami TaxID=75366 RepID=UPI0007AD614B|nr:PREDICTED: ATP-binding cassette sub-family G member 2-like [Sinocyclocheilus grahami]
MADTAVQMSRVADLENNVSTRTSSSSARRGATVSFHSISYSVKMKSGFLCKRKLTQKNILIQLKFLDVLAARKDPAGLSGEVLIDGAPQPPNFKCLSGYVVQDDVVMGTLTVRENLRFSAALRLPKSIRQREKDEKVERLIQELGLSKVADSRVGTQLIRGISGGERKRTNIGMELIIDPPVLFLDEPTTGLDASTANSVLMLLKRMANSGRTIILSIHQPRYSIYRLFDSLTLLVGGRLVYHGPAQDALDYFMQIGYTCEPHNNPADFFLDVINGDSTAVTLNKLNGNEDLDQEQLSSSLKGIEDRLVEEYKNSSSYKQTKSELERIVQGQDYSTRPKSRTITYNTSFFHQFNWVLKRTFRNLMLNPQTSFAQIGVTIFLALVVGVIFFGVKDNSSGIQNRIGVLFFITINQCFSAVSSAELFIAERNLFVHEYISGYYRVSVYFLSKILSDILTLRTIPAFIFSCVAYWMIGLKASAEPFFIFLFSIIPCSTGEGFLSAQGIDYSTWGLWQNHLALGIMTLIFLIIAYLKSLQRETDAPPPSVLSLQRETDASPPSVLSLQSETDAPPPSVLSLQSETDAPPPSVLSLQSETDAPPPSVLSLQSETDAPPPSVLSLQRKTGAPPPSVLSLQRKTGAPPPSVLSLQRKTGAPPPSVLSLQRETDASPPSVCSTGEGFLSAQGIDYSTWGLWQNHLALGIMTLIFLIIAYLKLRFIKKFS